MAELNRYSKTITQDETQPAAQAMLYGIGLTEDDLKKAQVGIVSMGYDGNTCNMHLNDLAKLVKQGVWDNDLVGLIFNTIGVSDGISNGTDGEGEGAFGPPAGTKRVGRRGSSGPAACRR